MLSFFFFLACVEQSKNSSVFPPLILHESRGSYVSPMPFLRFVQTLVQGNLRPVGLSPTMSQISPPQFSESSLWTGGPTFSCPEGKCFSSPRCPTIFSLDWSGQYFYPDADESFITLHPTPIRVAALARSPSMDFNWMGQPVVQSNPLSSTPESRSFGDYEGPSRSQDFSPNHFAKILMS